MTRAGTDDGRRFPWRAIGWSIPVFLLLLPLAAGAPWTASDFVFMGVLFAIVGITLELTVRASASPCYRAGIALALAAGFLLIVVNGSVGVIGSEDDPANLMFAGVIVVGVLGAVMARSRAAGMVRAMAAAAAVQSGIALIAFVTRFGGGEAPGRWGILLINGFFVALLLASAWLFRRAARGYPRPRA